MYRERYRCRTTGLVTTRLEQKECYTDAGMTVVTITMIEHMTFTIGIHRCEHDYNPL